MIYPAQHITYLNKDAHFLKKIYNECIPSIKFPLCFVIKSFSLCSLMTAFFQSISSTFHPHPYHLFNNTITTILFHIDLLFSTRSGYSQFSWTMIILMQFKKKLICTTSCWRYCAISQHSQFFIYYNKWMLINSSKKKVQIFIKCLFIEGMVQCLS